MSEHISIMLNGTIYDMFGEFYYFLSEVYPELKDFCRKYDIELEFKDVSFSLYERNVDVTHTILEYLNQIDEDRTFYICFRGQRLGWIPDADVIDKHTLDVFPELVNYIGNISINELSILHALIPFDKFIDGEQVMLHPVKHSLFYFRKSDYLCSIDPSKRPFYLDKNTKEDEEVQDMKVAKAKDIVHDIKRDFDKEENSSNIIIRDYDGEYDENIKLFDIIEKYTKICSDLSGLSYDELINLFEPLSFRDIRGCVTNFEYEGRPLKDVIIEDFKKEIQLEFPEKFN